MKNTINRAWKVYLLKRRIQKMNDFFDQKISNARSSLEADSHHKEKVASICSLASHFLQKD